MPLDDAQVTILQHASCISDMETLDLLSANGRVLARPLIAPMDSPVFNASVMDGYAVNCRDINSNGPTTLPVSQRITAGQTGSALQTGSAARIFTGAPVPENADAVVAQESCSRDGDKVSIECHVRSGQNIRYKGSHIRQGDTLIEAGIRLQAAHLGLAATQGRDKLTLYRRLKIALINSGDELVMPGQALGPGQIYNSNHFTLGALLSQLNCEITNYTVADNIEQCQIVLQQAANEVDMIISSGGVSVGEEDHIRTVVEELGALDLWRVRIKPGKPFAFGRIGDTPFLGLPGNPVSSLVTFCLLARPYILKTQGMTETQPISFPVKADFDWPKPGQRREYLRVSIFRDNAGEVMAQPYPSQDSATLRSVSSSDGLLCIPEGTTFKRGTCLEFYPFMTLFS